MGHQECPEKGGIEMRWTYNPEAVEPPDEEMFNCPVCGEEIPYGTQLYYNSNKECVGCEHCLDTKFVEDVYEEERFAYRERMG